MTLELYTISQPASKRPARGQEVNSVLAGTHPAGARRSTASRLVPTQLVPLFPSDLRSRVMRLAGGARDLRSEKNGGTSWVGTSRVALHLLAPAWWVPAESLLISFPLAGRWLAGWLYSLHYRPPTQLV